MSLNVEGKRILITGGNSGIGEAAALLMAKAGAEIILTSRDAGRAESVASDIASARELPFPRKFPNRTRRAVKAVADGWLLVRNAREMAGFDLRVP